MYFHLVYAPEFFAVASRGKSTRKLFRQATEFMDVIDHEFVENPTSSPFAFPSCPSNMGISLPLGKRPLGVFWDTLGRQKPKSKMCANANFVCL